jgi:hypothetical protein
MRIEHGSSLSFAQDDSGYAVQSHKQNVNLRSVCMQEGLIGFRVRDSVWTVFVYEARRLITCRYMRGRQSSKVIPNKWQACEIENKKPGVWGRARSFTLHFVQIHEIVIEAHWVLANIGLLYEPILLQFLS